MQSPSAAQTGRRASSAEALVTGNQESLRGAVADTAGGMPNFYFTPRPPLPGTEPSLAYPPGWNITGQTLTVPRGGFTSAWILQIEGWDTNHDGDQILLRSFHNKIDAAGCKGANASPSSPGCDLIYPAPVFACRKVCVGGSAAGNLCGTAGNCPGGTCPDPCPSILGEPGPLCGATLAGYCDWGWQNTSRADWVFAADSPANLIPAAEILSPTGPRFAGSTDPGFEIYDDGRRFYTGTLLLPIPACARGTYTIGHNMNETFWQAGDQPSDYPIGSLVSGVLEIPIGSCCTDFANPSQATCTPNLLRGECDALPSANLQIFRPDTDCNTPCEVGCVNDTDCDDNLFCNGIETCTATRCQPAQPPCASYEACNETAHVCTLPRIPTMSQWGIAALTLILLIAAKIGFQRRMESSN